MKDQTFKYRVLKDRLRSLVSSTTNIGDDVEILPGEVWSYDVKNKKLMYPLEGPFGVNNVSEKVALGALFHEIAHNKWTSQLDIKDGIPEKYVENFCLLANTVEDVRIERLMQDEYLGVRDFFKASRGYGVEMLTEERLHGMSKASNFNINVLLAEYGATQLFSDEKTEELYHELKKDIAIAASKKTSDELVDHLHGKVWPKYLELLEEDSQQKESKGDGDDKNDNSGNAQGDSEQENKPTDIKDILQDIYDGMGKEEAESLKSGESFMDNIQERADMLADDDQQAAENDYELDTQWYKSYEELYAEVACYIPYFAKKLGSVLKDNSYNRHGGNYKIGKLNNKKLYKVKCGNQRVFTKKIMREHKNYTVTLLVDESGSMQGYEMEQAVKTTILMAEVLNKVGIPFSIIGNSTTYRVYKEFDDKFTWRVKRNIEAMQAQVTQHHAWGTCIAYGTWKAAQMLKGRDSENIVLTMCDGGESPSGKVLDEDLAKIKKTELWQINLSEELAALERLATVVGIGLELTGLEEWYKHSIAVDDLQTLAPQVLRIIKSQIIRA